MLNQRYLSTFIVLLALLMFGCNEPTPAPTATATVTTIPTNTSTPQPTASQTSIPTSTFTPLPTSTNTLTATSSPSPTPSCNADKVLRDIKDHFPYDEFEVHYNILQGETTLVIWYVEPEIIPNASGDEIEQNALSAMRSAAKVSHQIAKENECIGRLFTAINPVVVDENYNEQLIIIIVNDRGSVGLIGILPSGGIKDLDLNQLQILFE